MDTAPTEPSRITILRAPGKRLTKTYARDRAGKVTKRNYDNAKFFDAEVREFHGIDGLAELLRELQRRTDSCVIRAAPGASLSLGRQAGAAAALPRGRVGRRPRQLPPARQEPADRARQEADIAAGRLWPVTVLADVRGAARPTGCCSTSTRYRHRPASSGATIRRGRLLPADCSCRPSSTTPDAVLRHQRRLRTRPSRTSAAPPSRCGSGSCSTAA